MGDKQLIGENSSLGEGNVWAWWLSFLFPPRLENGLHIWGLSAGLYYILIAQYPGMHSNRGERLTAKMSWIMFPLHYLIAGYEGKW